MDKTAIINELVGLPWLKLGRDPNVGLDCWGFVRYFYLKYLNTDIQIDFPVDPSDTKKVVETIEGSIAKKGNWQIDKSRKDFSVLALSRGVHFHHVGVWLDNGCLHAIEPLGVVYNSIQQLKRNGYKRMEFYTCTH